jgi:uncharacterized protein (DUF4415 family)
MIVNQHASPRTLGSESELNDDLPRRAVVKKGGRPKSASPRQLISLRLPVDVISMWRATGPGWQTRMAERLARDQVVRANSEFNN